MYKWLQLNHGAGLFVCLTDSSRREKQQAEEAGGEEVISLSGSHEAHERRGGGQ